VIKLDHRPQMRDSSEYTTQFRPSRRHDERSPGAMPFTDGKSASTAEGFPQTKPKVPSPLNTVSHHLFFRRRIQGSISKIRLSAWRSRRDRNHVEFGHGLAVEQHNWRNKSTTPNRREVTTGLDEQFCSVRVSSRVSVPFFLFRDQHVCRHKVER
jgi:hypothetical protein